MKAIRKLSLWFILLLLGCGELGYAQEDPRANWNGQTTGSHTLNSDVTLSKTVKLTGNLTITVGSDAHSIKRGNFAGTMFDTNGHNLTIVGTSENPITIDGGTVYNTDYVAQSGVKTQGKSGVILAVNRALTLTNVIIQNSYGGNAIRLDNTSNTRYDATLTDVTIRGCYDERGAAVFFVNTDWHEAVFTRLTVSGCYSNEEGTSGAAGVIRSYGGVRSRVTLSDCTITNNKSSHMGGAIYWNAAGRADTKIILTDNTKLTNNVAGTWGGGIFVESRMDILSADISGNTAANGGGIYMHSYYGGAADYDGDGYTLTIADGVTIKNNTASEAGGGVYMEIACTNDIGYNASGTPISPEFKLDIMGGEISGNRAPIGAGVAIYDYAAKRHYNTKSTDAAYHKWSLEYRRNVYIRGGEIKNNICDSTASNTYGAGIYIMKYKDNAIDSGSAGYNYTQAGGAGSMNVEASGGLVYGNVSRNGNKNGVGGGLCINNEIPQAPYNGVCEMSIDGDVEFYDNISDSNGAGIYINNGSITVSGGTIGKTGHPNITYNGDGAGFYVTNGNVTISDGHVDYNLAKNGTNATNDLVGGNGGAFYQTGGSATIKGGSVSYNTADKNGGGFVVVGGNVNISKETIGNPPVIANNTAARGGGFYVSDGSVTVSDATISGNTTMVGNGGAFDIINGNLTVSNSSITGNSAPNGNGGGAFVGNGNVVFNAGTTVTNNTAINGGGLCIDGGIINCNNGTITGNTATGNGGGIYVNAGSLNDTTFFTGGTVSNNTAGNGGGVYINGGTLDFSSGTFSQNYASHNGGGIYVKQGTQVLLSGNARLTKNHVPETLGNAVGNGGGIYLGGQLKVGRNAGDAQGTHSLKVEDNYMGIEANNILNNIYLPTNDNVIELLSDVRNSSTKVGFSVNNGFRKVVYHNNDGATSTSSWLHGLLTEGGSQGLTGVIFDDSRKYMAVHVLIQDQTFDHNYIYLWGCWISAVDKDPQAHLIEYPLPAGVGQHYTIDVANDSTWHIYTKEGLAWLSSSVNGLNGCKYRPGTKAVMERDVDMSDFLWVPLGSAQSFDPTGHDPTSAIFTDGHEFSGSFDGKGHVISGLDCRYINSIHDYGLFGKVTGNAVITNVIVRDYNYDCSQETTSGYMMGGIAGSVSGGSVVSNCVAYGMMQSPESTLSRLGGIVGVLDGAQVHSCIGQPDMGGKAGYMGGLVGQTVGNSSILNSFANAMVTPTASTDTIGGLVGINTGTVANCYTRLRGTVPGTGANYGWLVGYNQTGGEVNYCYSPATDRYYKTNDGTLKGCGHYADNASAPYLYARLDNQVEIADDTYNNVTTNPHVPTEVNPNPLSDYCDKQLLLCLNHWVGSSTTYAKWQRPTTMAINGDYPVLLLPATDAVACTGNADGSEKDGFLHYGQVNDLLSGYTQATQAVWLYKKKDGLAGNSTSDAKLYIADKGFEGKPVTVIPSGTVKAYVGVMLDNSAGDHGANPTFGDGTPDYTDWHMFSSPLTSAPVGINYTNETQYAHSYGHPTGMPYWRFYPEDNANHGYFPSHRYGEEYPANDASLLAGNYYDEWDFYTYSEPEYHWINFKRNSNSHWHENDQNEPIHYYAYSGAPEEGNETNLIQGKGYLLATREQTFLQCQGTLADGKVTIPVTYSGAYSPGYNFLGNPYLAYLDFNKFAEANSGSGRMWADVNDAGYGIIDEDQKGYIYYATGASDNPMLATRYIAPHQGFMVHLAAAPANPATFTTGTVAGQSDMRSLVGDDGEFRGEERPAYPLVNMLAYDDNGNRSIATVELGRPDKGGLQLMRDLKGAKCHVYCRHEGEDWSVVFTQPGLSEVAIRFEALEDGEFTMRWDTQNGDFHYLHLVDNKTGADVDCLATDEYRFTATTEDYRSRFRLVFGYTGIEEPEVPEPVEGPTTFAFQSGDELVVTGEGTLTMFDVTGRAVMSTETYGTQTAAPLPGVAAGVYLLRLETANGTKVQKIVIK